MSAEEGEDLKKKIDSYMSSRVDQYAGWYDGKAAKFKRLYLGARIATAISAVMIPYLSNVSWAVSVCEYSIDIPKFLLTVLGVLIAVLIALEGVLHHREQWQNYRSTEQFITTQKNLFMNGVGDYAVLDMKDAFSQFVERIEKAIADENAVTLNVLTRSDSPSGSASD